MNLAVDRTRNGGCPWLATDYHEQRIFRGISLTVALEVYQILLEGSARLGIDTEQDSICEQNFAK